MNYVLVGDPHLRVSMLAEGEQFLRELETYVDSVKPDFVMILGDLFNDFAVLRSEVIGLWSKFFERVGRRHKIVVLVGNHDLAGASGTIHALEPFTNYPNVVVVSQAMTLPLGNGIHVSYFPFIREKAEFESMARALPAGSYLFCHQEFDGCKFENGFYSPHGASPECVAHLEMVISGHIHAAQIFGNIWYPGTPMQMSFGDAGHDKGVYLVELTPKKLNVKHCQAFDLPRYEVLEAKDVAQLVALIGVLAGSSNINLSKLNVKLIAQGTPSEISAFWEDPAIRQFKSQCKRVVDAMTSVKLQAQLPGSKGKTHKEKLYEFIRSKKWRSSPEQLTSRAEECLARAAAKN